MKITLLPKTKPGRWSVGLALGVFFFFYLHQIGLVIGLEAGNRTFFSNLYAAIPILMSWVSGTLAFFTGIIGIIKGKDHSILLIPAILIGFFVFIFGLGEVISPH